MAGFLNQIKTVILLGSLSAVMLFCGMFFGGYTGLTIMFVFAILVNLFSYFFADKMVLRMYKAKEITNKNDKLYKIVKDISNKAKIPMPKVYLIPDKNANAFACGRNPNHSSVAATIGIMELLTDKELEGVIAHECAHIKNRDILIATIAATIATIISYIANIAWFAAIFGGGRDNDNALGNILYMLVLIILTPLIATMIQLAISRTREYLADSTGAKIINDPLSLANALDKLEKNNNHNPMRFGNRTTASLFITNPFSGMSLIGLFSTHPPIQKRIEKLKAL